MDVSDNSQRDLNEIVFETKLESRNIISIFQSILFEYDTKWRLFFFIEQNKLTYGTLPYLKKKIERQINITETHIKKEWQEHIVKCYAEQRQVLIVVLSGDAILVTDSELLNILFNKIKRNIADGKQLKRHMDTDIFLETFFLYQMNHDTKDNAGKYYGTQHPQNKPLAANKNYTKRNDNVSTSAPSNLRPLTPRPPHSTTFIEPDKRDIFDEDISVTTIPNDKNVYRNKSYPPSSPGEDKHPSKVLEIDAAMYSFEPYPGHTSTIPSATRRSESGQTGFSYQGEVNSSIRLATMQRRKIISCSGIPYFSKPSRYTEYQDQKKRYDSFQTPKWLTDSKSDISLLVGCGFFFTENNDLVRCYHCGIGLKDWTKSDDPLTQHVKYSPTCDFLIWRYGKSKGERTKAALTNESRSPPPSYTIRSPCYQTMEARLASFENFPSGNSIPHQQLAVAGLFFTGQGDLCRCFRCDGGLKDWSSGDDPIKEHARYFPNCSYINSLKGQQYVQCLQPRGLENEHICCRKDDIGGYYTSSQRSDRTGNITERKDICCFVDGGCTKDGKRSETIGEQNIYFPDDTNRNESKRYTTLQTDVLKSGSTAERNQNSTSQTTQNNGYTVEYTTILRKSTKNIVWHLAPQLVLDEFTTCGFLTNIEIRDIEELLSTSEKNRAILRKVMTKGVNGYKTFKNALRQSNQTLLLELLVNEELS